MLAKLKKSAIAIILSSLTSTPPILNSKTILSNKVIVYETLKNIIKLLAVVYEFANI